MPTDDDITIRIDFGRDPARFSGTVSLSCRELAYALVTEFQLRLGGFHGKPADEDEAAVLRDITERMRASAVEVIEQWRKSADRDINQWMRALIMTELYARSMTKTPGAIIDWMDSEVGHKGNLAILSVPSIRKMIEVLSHGTTDQLGQYHRVQDIIARAVPGRPGRRPKSLADRAEVQLLQDAAELETRFKDAAAYCYRRRQLGADPDEKPVEDVLASMGLGDEERRAVIGSKSVRGAVTRHLAWRDDRPIDSVAASLAKGRRQQARQQKAMEAMIAP